MICHAHCCTRNASAGKRRNRNVDRHVYGAVNAHQWNIKRNPIMSKAIYIAVLLALTTASASAQGTQYGGSAQIMNSIPANSATVTHWYKQNVYDPSDNKIGEIMDVLVDREGRATAMIIGVGGFLGMGEKDVAVPFSAVRTTEKSNNKWYLVMNTTKDALKSAKGFKYDRNAMTWIPEEQPATTGGQQPAPAPRSR
jgi:sporulation protein YlmC with PRC-barrel domain